MFIIRMEFDSAERVECSAPNQFAGCERGSRVLSQRPRSFQQHHRSSGVLGPIHRAISTVC